MKLRKIVSGILACAMIFSSVPVAGNEVGGGTSIQQGPHLSYIAPEEGGIPMPARVSAGSEHYEQFADRAKEPAALVDVYTDRERQIENQNGIWGFNGQVKTEASDDKFDVTGNTPMIIAFKLYLKKMGAADPGNVIIAKGDKQYCITLIGNGLRFHAALTGNNDWRNYAFNNCFTKTNQWYDIVFVKDGDEGVRFYVDDQAGELASYRSLAHFDDAFSIGTQMSGGNGRRDFTSEYGYVADVKFYNGAAMEEQQKEEFEQKVNLREWDKMEDDGIIPLYQLLESMQPTADFSLRPFRTSTQWSEGEDSSEFTGSFKCGTEYTATTTLTVRDGEEFRFTEEMAETVKSSITDEVYFKQIGQLTGTAESEEKSSEDGKASNAVDGNNNTIWHSNYNGINQVNLNSDPKVNNNYTITLKNPSNIDKFEYVPRQGGGENGIIRKANLYYSTTADGDDFVLAAENLVWAQDRNTKEVLFDEQLQNVKRFRIETLEAFNNFITAAEFCLYEKKTSGVSSVETEIASEGKQMTVKSVYPASSMPCIHSAESVSLGNIVDMEAGKTRQLNPKVLMDDGMPLSSHKGFAAQSIVYTYESDTPAVAMVDESGIITAVSEGKAKVTVTATIAGHEPIEMQVDVEVFAEGNMFLHPEMMYQRPEVGNYPEIAEVWLNRELSDSHPTIVTDVAEGEARLVPVTEDSELIAVEKEGLIGFNGQYKSTHTTNQFNVTGSKPLVIMFKLWVDKLPSGAEKDNERAIVTKGNQFSFAIKNHSETGNVPKLRLGMMGINEDWPVASYTIPEGWTGKWHDIVIVFDGKGTKNSMGFFVDGEFVANETEHIGTIGEKDNVASANGDPLRPFTICGKAEELDQEFTKDYGYLAGLKFFDVSKVAPELVEEIDLSNLGNEHGAAMIKYMLDAKDRTAHITATPYKMQTTWSVAGEQNVLDGKTPFTAQNIRDKGYTATTVLTAYGDFVFDAGEVDHITEELRHIYIQPDTEASLIKQTAEISEDNKVLTVKVTFLPRKMQAPSITYTSPIPGGTPRRQPISNDTDAHYTMADSVWSVLGGDVIQEDQKFAPITESNKYQVRTVLTTKGDYLFDNSAGFIDQTKKNIRTQRFGNVDADVNVEVSSDGSTMTITVTYQKPIYTVAFDLNGATTPALEEMQSVSEGNHPNAPTEPQKDGSKFICWYESGDESQTSYNFDQPVTNNISLVAKWARYLKVTFDSGIEGNTAEIKTILEGQKVEKPQDPENGSNVFLGWYLKVGDNYTVYDFDRPVTEEITLYARWKDGDSSETAHVTFMDGTTEIAQKDVSLGDIITLPDEPKKPGYTFAGWYVDPECTQEFNIQTPIVSDMTLYAKWEPEEVTEITLDPAEFTLPINGTQKLSVKAGSETIDDSEINWSSDDDSVATVDDKGLVTAKAAGTTKIKAALKANPENAAEAIVTVKGTEEKKKYTVTFDSKGGSAIASQKVEEGAPAAAPANPVKAGFVFEGWYMDEAFQKAYDFKTPVTGNMTLYAKWAEEVKTLKKGEETVVGKLAIKVLDPDKRTVAISKGMTKNARKVTLPGKIKVNNIEYTVIGVANKAFRNNKKISQITIPASVKSVGTQAFAGCKNLKKVILKGKTFKPGKSSFKGTSSKLKILAKKMSGSQRKALQKAIRGKGKNKKAKVTR